MGGNTELQLQASEGGVRRGLRLMGAWREFAIYGPAT